MKRLITNIDQAESIINQINDALNALAPVPSNVAGTRFDFSEFLPNTSSFYYIPVAFDGINVITSRRGKNNDVNTWVTETADFFTGTAVSTTYAGATLTNQEFKQVPEPLTILGSGTALAFGTVLKRKIAKAKKK